jgi:hypothetical protein
MQRRLLNISAALAVAIERQIDDIIANAKARCALQYTAAARRGLAEPKTPASAALAPPVDCEDLGADRRRARRGAAARVGFRGS